MLKNSSNSVNIFSIILTVIITAVVSAGGVFWQQSLVAQEESAKAEAVQDDLRNQISLLQDQIAFLQQKTNPQSQAVVTSTTRTEIGLANYKQVFAVNGTSCPAFIPVVATTTATYENNRWGVQLALPYSEAWGNDNYKVAAAEYFSQSGTTLEGILFGAPILDTDCNLNRDYSLTINNLPIKEATTSESLFKGLSKNNKQYTALKRVEIGEGAAVKYQEVVNKVTLANLAYFFKDSNYLLTTSCVKTNCTKAFQSLEKIAGSIKVLVQ